MIIGITGTFCSGKGTVSKYLVERFGFKHLSARTVITEYLGIKNPLIEDLRRGGNEIRKKYGPGYIAEELFKRAGKSKQNCVIESLRTPAEILSLKNKGLPFNVFAVDADPKIRFARSKKQESGAYKNFKTVKEMLSAEKKQMNSTDPSLQNLRACIKMANFHLTNNNSLPSLFKQVEQALKVIDKGLIKQSKAAKRQNRKITNVKSVYKRPSWDDYFMEVSDAISKRASCDRGRSGCVITKNKQILATGYVGSPAGFPNCDEVGHDLRKAYDEDGVVREHCVRTVHAEQNAICQAAKRGITIDGADIYCRMTPCRVCAMLLINCGVKRVYCERKYISGKESEKMLKKAGIKLIYKFNEVQKYKSNKLSSAKKH